ncbi:threonine ammonia-lyase [Helicobacter cinaedi]|uniref:threonine ammonia-lyase n=1 Tax=Helicobacter cinaedi TaxID=213 RepID=UPI000CF1B899|nr:threonine ammonia-lyase [Helicobacter cinaedi]
MQHIYDKVLEARQRLQGVIAHTPLSYAPVLSQLSLSEIYLKKENLQLTGAFKIRGAFNKIASLVESSKAESNKAGQIQGVIAASAGNHAQGVAYSARHFGIQSVIVMPEATPLLKVSATKALGAEVVLCGDNYDEAFERALQIAKERDLVFIHPFADELVIAGQGSIGLEIIEEKDDIDVVVVPIGGGGLLGGIGSVIKTLKPSVRVIGVVASGADAMKRSFASGKIERVESVRSIADGIAVRDVNAENFALLQQCVDEIVSVDDEEIANAILFLLEKQKLVVEGAGAASVASVLHKKFSFSQSDKIALVLSGGNIDITMLNVIIEKGLLKSNRKMKLEVVLIDKPGSLQGLTNILSKVGANIVQIEYDRTSVMLKYGDALVTMALETKGEEHKEQIRENLKNYGYFFNEIN